jgi:hypothetical protein
VSEPSPLPPSPPSRLGEAVDGFVGLARWFTGLVGDDVAQLARAVDSGSIDTDTTTAALARLSVAPLLGWAALVNEVFDAASVVTSPFHRERTVTSPFFDVPGGRGYRRALALDGGMTNGFGERLPAPVSLVGSGAAGRARGLDGAPAPGGALLEVGERQFRLQAADVPASCVGIYSGKVVARVLLPDGTRSPVSPATPIDVWMVVP